MAIRVYKPTSPARRFMSVLTYEEITKKKPEKSLTEWRKRSCDRPARAAVELSRGLAPSPPGRRPGGPTGPGVAASPVLGGEQDAACTHFRHLEGAYGR